VIVGLLTSIPAAPNALADDYARIGGTIDFSAYKGPNAVPQPQSHRTYRFQCTVGSRKWTILSKFLANAVEYFSFDGTNVYRVLEYTALATNGTAKPAAAFSTESVEQLNSSKFLTISPGPLPLQDAGVNFPWLAFCSGEYLKSENRLIPLLICDTRHRPTAFGYDDVTEVFEDERRLPRALQLMESRKRFAESPKDERLFGDVKGRAANFKPVEGRIAFTYNVDETTNYHGSALPIAFHCDQYSYSPAGELDTHIVGSGKVLSITESGEPDTNPFGKEPAYRVIDFRFKNREKFVDSIMYTWTNSALPRTDEQIPQKEWKRTLERRR